MTGIPADVRAMAGRGPEWAAWVDGLEVTVRLLIDQWRLRPDGDPTHGHCSLVLPVRTADAVRQIGAVLEGSRNVYWPLTAWQNLMYFELKIGFSELRKTSLFCRKVKADRQKFAESRTTAT